MQTETGLFLIRRRDGMLARIVDHQGGAHDWYSVALASGRVVSVTASGIRAKYDRVPADVSAAAAKIVREEGLSSTTLDRARKAVSGR